jgi:hypothetical protein
MRPLVCDQRVTFKCPSNLVRLIEKTAAAEYMSASSWIRHVLTEKVRNVA